jgi:hypothetical protein
VSGFKVKETKKKRHINKVIVFSCLIALLFAGVYLAKTWPYNFAGSIIYRLLGKPIPNKKSEALAHIKQFLQAKRKLDKKDYKSAQATLEDLQSRISPRFLFFKEVYLYLGYIYDVTGDFRKEESLYRGLEKKDPVLSKFLYGLYYMKHGQAEKGRGLFSEALLLDNKAHRLGNKYRAEIERVLKASPKSDLSSQDK